MSDSHAAVTTAPGTELLFENEHVRVWWAVIEPGEKSPVHRHLRDHVLIYAEPGHIRGWTEGSAKEIVQEVDPGWVCYRSVGRNGLSPHHIQNIGTERSTHYIIELLGESATETPQPPVWNERGRVVFPDDDPDRG